jgi:hypothetical protein
MGKALILRPCGIDAGQPVILVIGPAELNAVAKTKPGQRPTPLSYKPISRLYSLVYGVLFHHAIVCESKFPAVSAGAWQRQHQQPRQG